MTFLKWCLSNRCFSCVFSSIVPVLSNVLVHSRRRFLRGVPSQFTEAHLPWTNRPFTESVPHLRELTSSFAESVKNYKYSALHACMCMHGHVRILSWLYPAKFNQHNRVRSAQRNWVHSSQRNWVRSTESIVLTIWTTLHLPFHIKFRHSKRAAIENLLFVCFNHTVFTLFRVWQPLTTLRLRASRLDGGAPLLLPVVPFWQKKRKQASEGNLYKLQRKCDEIRESPPALTPTPPPPPYVWAGTSRYR